MSRALDRVAADVVGLDRVLARQGHRRAGEAATSAITATSIAGEGSLPFLRTANLPCYTHLDSCHGLPPPIKPPMPARKFRRAMRIWVDCTAAAHPLVLRPIIERLRARGDEVEITAREYGQTVGILERLGLAHEVVGSHGGGSTAAKGLALARRSGALARWARGRGASTSRSPTARSTSRSSPRRCGSRSAQMQDYEYAGLQRQLAFRAARRVLVPDAIGVEAMRRAGAARAQARPLPGAEGGLLPRRLRRPTRRCSPSSASIASGCSRSSARRRRLPPITSATPSTTRCSTGFAGRGRRGRGGDPAHRARRPTRSAARSDPVADRPRARDRRPEPDRLRRPRRQRRRDDEPRGGRARNPRLHDLQRPHGRRRRAPDRRRPAAAARRPGAELELVKRDVRARPAPSPRPRPCWSRRSSRRCRRYDDDVRRRAARRRSRRCSPSWSPRCSPGCWCRSPSGSPGGSARSTTRTQRSLHTDPTPKLGGLAIFVGTSVAAILFLPWAEQTQALLIGAVVIVDGRRPRRRLRPQRRC